MPPVLAVAWLTCASGNGLITWTIVLLAARSGKGVWACLIGDQPECGAVEWTLRHRQERSAGGCVSRIIEDRNLLALAIGVVVVNHGVYFTEGIDPGEGLVPSPTSPNRASPELTTVH